MATIKEQIEMIRAEIDKTQKNKATNAHIGKLKAKIAQLKLKEEKAAAHSKASGGGKGFEVKKSGDATVSLVGFPSVGKSTLISKVTDAHSEAGGYAFTTLTCIPGVMEHRGAKIQILDLPGLIKGAAEGKAEEKKFSMSSALRTWFSTSLILSKMGILMSFIENCIILDSD